MDNGTQKAVQMQRMGILLCEQNFLDVWIRNKSVRAEIGHILRAHTHTHVAKLVVEMYMPGEVKYPKQMVNRYPVADSGHEEEMDATKSSIVYTPQSCWWSTNMKSPMIPPNDPWGLGGYAMQCWGLGGYTPTMLLTKWSIQCVL